MQVTQERINGVSIVLGNIVSRINCLNKGAGIPPGATEKLAGVGTRHVVDPKYGFVLKNVELKRRHPGPGQPVRFSAREERICTRARIAFGPLLRMRGQETPPLLTYNGHLALGSTFDMCISGGCGRCHVPVLILSPGHMILSQDE